tara:strand:- start:348 stop:755 length:408 start_codon:yes stop_codon:yes gene_type:complete
MLTLGSSAPSAFLGQPITTVRNQVDYYVQRFDFDTVSDEYTPCSGVCWSTTGATVSIQYRRRMRATPATASSPAATFYMLTGQGSALLSSIDIPVVGRDSSKIVVYTASTWTDESGCILHRDGTDACYLQFDARH